MPTHTSVLIIGGGPVGLALAIELGWRGIACLLIEQGDGSIVTPKMNEVNTRTMEFCRRWGIADQVLNCPFPGDHPLDAVFVTNMFGHELGRVSRPARNTQTPEPHSPYRLQACSQIWFDPILAERARSFPTVQLHYLHRLDSFSQDADGVTADITEIGSGKRRRITADFMAGCDGANSLIRRTLDIKLTGKGTIGYPINMFFRAPKLLARSGRLPGTFFILVDRSGVWGNLRIIDPSNDVWRLMVDTASDVTPDAVDREGYLHRALGSNLAVEWIDVNVWRRRSLVAERYGEGRISIAGDAAHQLSPTGALGMNSGIGDAVDLGWKLAARLQGWGGKQLLDSYDGERRPVGERNVRMATSFYKDNETFSHWSPLLQDSSIEGDRARHELGKLLEQKVGGEFRTLGLQIGYCYEGSPICIPDGTTALDDDPANYVANARPGARAPHAWIGRSKSTLDLFGHGFVLLRFPGSPEATALASAAAARQLPLTTTDITSPDAAVLYERRLVLVRPDGHVAWRSDDMPADAGALIDHVRGEIHA